MNAVRIPRVLLYSELSEGARKVGALKLRFKHQLKNLLSECDITNFEAPANEKRSGENAVKTGVARFEQARI